MTTELPEIDKGAILKTAAQVPAGANLVEYNPLENIPTLSVGEDIVPNTTINGYYEGTERIASPKFTHAKERDERGVPCQYLHKMKLLDGTIVGIWSTGELKAVFDRMAVGEFLSLKYLEKGVNAKGQAQHFFEYKKVKPAGH
jgi:hypothetical protein